MARLNTASTLDQGLFYIIMMPPVVLDGENQFIQARFDEVCNWAPQSLDQRL